MLGAPPAETYARTSSIALGSIMKSFSASRASNSISLDVFVSPSAAIAPLSPARVPSPSLAVAVRVHTSSSSDIVGEGARARSAALHQWARDDDARTASSSA